MTGKELTIYTGSKSFSQVNYVQRNSTGFTIDLSYSAIIAIGLVPGLTIADGSQFNVSYEKSVYHVVSPGNKLNFNNKSIPFDIYIDDNKFSNEKNFSLYHTIGF